MTFRYIVLLLWVIGPLDALSGCSDANRAKATGTRSESEAGRAQHPPSGAWDAMSEVERMTLEASENVKRIASLTRQMYGNQGRIPEQSAPPTPALGTCCREEGGLCQPKPELWQRPPWSELGFRMDSPHRYSYAYDVHRRGPTLTFTARAFGDLDCDGEYSTFEMWDVVE